jgi:preprotein translocase subunit SecE
MRDEIGAIAIVVVFTALVAGIVYLLGAVLTAIFKTGGWHFPWS